MSGRGSDGDLTGGRLLARNTVWSLVAQLLPTAVGVVTIPILVHGLGLARFGLFSLAWIAIGYFSLFDLGLGRALTKVVADKLGGNQEQSIPALAWTSLLILLGLGILLIVPTVVLAPWLVHRVLKVPIELQQETLTSCYLLATAIPAVTVTSGLRGILEAKQRFFALGAIRVPMNVFLFAGPLLVLPFSRRLVPLIVVLVVGRLVGGLAHLWLCFRVIPGLLHEFSIRGVLVVPVLKLSGWMNITNLLSPVLVYLDRFLVGALLSVSVVPFYTVPFDVITRLWIIPNAVGSVLFPAFAVSLLQNRERTGVLLSRGLKYVFVIVFPLTLVAAALAPEGLQLWLGPAFAHNSTAVLRWLAGGVLVNALAQIAAALILGAGRPDWTVKLQLAELPFYFAALLPLVKWYGVTGASIAWTVRLSVETLIVFYLACRLLPEKKAFAVKICIATAAALGVIYLTTLMQGLPARLVCLSVLLAVFFMISWIWVLDAREKAFLRESSARYFKRRVVKPYASKGTTLG